MGWFEDLTGFTETPAAVRTNLRLEGNVLVSLVSGRRASTGSFELVPLGELRRRVADVGIPHGHLRFRSVSGEARAMHSAPGLDGALFQVASQFNCLEMPNPRVRPEQGVSGYENDRTQGPACAIAAGAATIYRNYFVPVGDQIGQTERRQLDGLAALRLALERRHGFTPDRLWRMRNGYAICSSETLEALAEYLGAASTEVLDDLRQALAIGVHWDAEVTDGTAGRFVTQAFCSALPVAYGYAAPELWAPFARLILEATYEATILTACLNASRGASRTVVLTLVGGGAFGNREEWILDAMRRSLRLAADADLDIRLVALHAPSDSARALESEFARQREV